MKIKRIALVLLSFLIIGTSFAEDITLARVLSGFYYLDEQGKFPIENMTAWNDSDALGCLTIANEMGEVFFYAFKDTGLIYRAVYRLPNNDDGHLINSFILYLLGGNNKELNDYEVYSFLQDENEFLVEMRSNKENVLENETNRVNIQDYINIFQGEE